VEGAAQRRRPVRGPAGVPSAFWHYLGAQSTADLDVEEHRALSKGTTTAGGFAVPTGFYNQLINISRFMGSMGQLANEIITDSGETLQVPTVTAHGVDVVDR
jgi:HK97 family phage major capsid protein